MKDYSNYYQMLIKNKYLNMYVHTYIINRKFIYMCYIYDYINLFTIYTYTHTHTYIKLFFVIDFTYRTNL